MLKDLVTQCRSYRRFFQDVEIPMDALRDMADNARLTASAANAQALKFKLINTPAECAAVFPCLRWAAALSDWDGPVEGERPAPTSLSPATCPSERTNSGTTESPPRPLCSARWRRATAAA